MEHAARVRPVSLSSFLAVVALTLAAPAGVLPGQAVALPPEARVALVIGNGTYPNAPLKNPANDARDMAAALRAVGFSVTLLVDGDLAGMNRAIRDFGTAIRRQDAVALFYYSGHGVQYQGANYLIPAKADIQGADELPYAAVNAEAVYAKMESAGARTNLIILDACRNNPFPGSERALERGLAVVGNVQPPRSLIVYSTAPGKTAQDGDGKNGVFTAALLKHLADPGLDAELMIRRVREDVIAATNGAQVPWHNSSITGQGFYFAGRGELAVTTDPSGAEISVNGERRGLSPLTLDDIPRFVEVRITATLGNRSAARTVTLRDSARMTLSLKLTREPGSLVIAASESYTSVLVDGAPVQASASGVVEGLEAGRHVLELKGTAAAYRGDVTVVGGTSTRVAVTMIPCGSLVLSLPQGSACRIEGSGSGISDTSTRGEYGWLPVGQYQLTVTGGEYDPYTESIAVRRGEVTQFAPRLRFTAAHLAAQYRTELDTLALAEKRSHVDDMDIDQVSAFELRVLAERRAELQAFADEAAKLKARLVALKAEQASSGQTIEGLPKTGPKDLFDACSAEFAQLSALESAATLTDADLEKARALTAKVQAEKYEDFQRLAIRAADLSDRLTARKASLERAAQVDSLSAKRAEYRKAAESANGLKTAAAWCYWIGVGGAGGAALSALTGFIIAVSPAYADATTIADATSLGTWIRAFGLLFWGFTITAGVSGLTGLGLDLFSPDPRPLADAIRRLDEQIQALGGAP